jgi:hypothetical protein
MPLTLSQRLSFRMQLVIGWHHRIPSPFWALLFPTAWHRPIGLTSPLSHQVLPSDGLTHVSHFIILCICHIHLCGDLLEYISVQVHIEVYINVASYMSAVFFISGFLHSIDMW